MFCSMLNWNPATFWEAGGGGDKYYSFGLKLPPILILEFYLIGTGKLLLIPKEVALFFVFF